MLLNTTIQNPYFYFTVWKRNGKPHVALYYKTSNINNLICWITYDTKYEFSILNKYVWRFV